MPFRMLHAGAVGGRGQRRRLSDSGVWRTEGQQVAKWFGVREVAGSVTFRVARRSLKAVSFKGHEHTSNSAPAKPKS